MILDKKQMYNLPKNYVKQVSVSYTPCIMCVQYIGGCSVHWRDTISTSVDVQYIGGIS